MGEEIIPRSPTQDVPNLIGSVQIGGSSEFIISSLQYHVNEFLVIQKDLQNYSGPSEVELSEIRESVWHTWGQSPDIRKVGFSEMIDDQIRIASESEFFRVNKFYQKFHLHALPIVLLSHALLEAYINNFVTIGLSVFEKVDFLEVFDKFDLKTKWLVGPRLFIEKMNIDPGDEKFGRLGRLISLRNSVTHHKAQIMVNDKKANKGSKNFNFRIDALGAKEVLAYSLLPDQLFTYVISFVSDSNVQFALNAARSHQRIKQA
jgi:hypothetical protein